MVNGKGIYKVKTKPLNEMNTAEFIGHIEDWGCHCDLLNNFTCGHSAIIFELAERLSNKMNQLEKLSKIHSRAEQGYDISASDVLWLIGSIEGIKDAMSRMSVFDDCVTNMAKIEKDCGHPILAMQEHCLVCHEKVINILLQRVKQLEDEKCQNQKI